MNWSESAIDSAMDSYVEKFVESKPRPPRYQDYDKNHYQQVYKGWQERKKMHENVARQNKDMIRNLAMMQWKSGGDVTSIHKDASKISNQSALKILINDKFRRWRIAKEVDGVFVNLNQYVVALTIEMDESSTLS